jgi:hypothetical protein
LGYPPARFELRTKIDNWNGTYIQNGDKKELKITMHASKTIFGIGKDSSGVFLVNGGVDTTTYMVSFTKSYPGKFKV